MSFLKSDERQTNELHVLTEVGKTLTVHQPLPELLTAVMERMAEVLEPAEFGVVLLWNPSEGVFRSQAMYGSGFPNLEALRQLNLQENESVTGRVYAQGEAVVLNNAAAIATAMDKFGVLILDTLYRQQAFSAKDVPFVQILADYMDGFEVAHRVREFSSVPILYPRPKRGSRTRCAALKSGQTTT